MAVTRVRELNGGNSGDYNRTVDVIKEYGVGSEFVGTYLSSKEINTKKGKATLHTFRLEDGEEVDIFGKTVLNSRLSDAEVGDLLEIEYLGMENGKSGGNDYHNFNVFLVEVDEVVGG
jgi:hypothetical protein